MKKRILTIALGLALVMVVLVGTVSAGGRGAYRGAAADPLHGELGVISYLATPAGYHFWFSATGDLGPYLAGHSYHNVYQLTVDDPGEWGVPVVVPDREPYNLVGHTGASVYYKIFDTTTDTQVVP